MACTVRNVVGNWRLLLLVLLLLNFCNSKEDYEYKIPMEKAMPPLMDPIPTLPTITHRVYMDVHMQGEGNIGRVIFGMFGDNSPAAVDHFINMVRCKNKKGSCFKESIFHRIIPNFGLQGGDVTHHDGTGGVPMPRGATMKETVKMTKPHLLAVASSKKDAASSQFFVTTVKTQWLTGKHVVMGIVLEGGEDVVNVVEQKAGTYGGVPRKSVTISGCGVLPLESEDREPHYY